MWQLFAATLSLVFLCMKHLFASDCNWVAVVNDFADLGSDRKIFFTQREIKRVAEIFKELTDSAIDPDDKNAKYLGFPYYLKINLSCTLQNSEWAIRTGHYTGLRPIVTVTFSEPVHPVRQKQEQLQIEMRAAPYRNKANCNSEEVCQMCWFTPMPFLNGTVVLDVLVESNGIGLPVKSRRFAININGYVGIVQNEVKIKIGEKLDSLKNVLQLRDPSRPLWYTYGQAPVLILGGIPRSKIVFMSDSMFLDYIPIEVGIDSCWIGSLSCPQGTFSSAIVDAISTESTLFIRQNQLVYYYTGNYPILHVNTSGSELWTRILNHVCVRTLNPVFFPMNGSEFVIALGGGWQEGEFFLITVRDGIVKASGSLREKEETVCDFVRASACSIKWATYSLADNRIYLLVHETGTDKHTIVVYLLDIEHFEFIYHIPEKVPKASDKGFVLLLGLEHYTNTTLIPRGLALNPFSNIFYIWGNAILQSNDKQSYIYLSSFPNDSPIKYFVQSFTGEIAFVTDREEIWVSKELGTEIKKVYPSEAWDVYNYLQVMRGSPHYSLTLKHSILTIFYVDGQLQELVYLADTADNGRLVRRQFPLSHVLTYDLLITTPNKEMRHNGLDYIRFAHLCPFAVVRYVDLPQPQEFTRMEHYFAMPPEIMEKTGFHDEKSLIVYQGLVYQLLQLHSSYHRAYADPVHDPTWRWWKNKKEDAEYYTYVASNWNTSAGIYVDMANYIKMYDQMPENLLPSKLYLDKNTEYSFSLYLSMRTTKQSMGESADENSLQNIWLTLILAHPEYIHTHLYRQELISRGSVRYVIVIHDKGVYPYQQLSGKNLLKSSFGLKVAHSGMNCYEYTSNGPRIRGSYVSTVYIGCPPGKRLAFDITSTKNETTVKNKRYFDCIKKDPEMPCFSFNDVFYPSFLIQDMVTGDSGRFNGSYIFRVIGGGPFSIENIRYFSEEETFNYNTMNGSETSSLIWLRAETHEDKVDSEGFHILSQAESGILWVCQTNSPCYDIVPQGMAAPDYFFVVEVSNRGVDESTYCDYALEFIIHVHGLRLSPTRAIFLLKVTIAIILGLLLLYIVVYITGPLVKALFNKTFRRLEEALAMRIESSLTFSSSFTSQGSLQHLASELSGISSPQSQSPKGPPQSKTR
ncbi:cation channel sperm-associated auxiliary subunit gamma isoform X2 [Podarcis raffonei]|nr:cation channel sperm-associated auxiliary subunit gamma isoform X2 [Podarcis raffonei]XP_053253726.1 cation channel sperm-associated auxiliary subunit gamma isoform X2 [Podarcis raffonei]XP_053253727.1 cation channel sperm-associated auxiliary subunit gamma isoform X2 [Podarcis raffonei]